MRSLRDYLDQRGYAYVDDLSCAYDVLLVAAWTTDYRAIRQAQRWNPGLRIVHRVDGAAQAYGRLDDGDARLARINTLADVTVFQSEYARKLTTTDFGLVRVDGPTIYNPVDTRLFAPTGEDLPLPVGIKVCNATWSTNRMKGTWQLPVLARQNPDIHFVLCGRYDGLPTLPNLHALGAVDRTQMARAMRSCDAFLSLSLNEACPNVIIEALASGLPILYVDSGAAAEVVGRAGVPVTPETFRVKLDGVIADLPALQREARRRAVTCFDLSVVGAQYLEVVESLRR